MTKRKFATDIHQDTYKCIAISTIHVIDNGDEDTMNTCVEDERAPMHGMVMKRDYGWFMKLYSEWDGILEDSVSCFSVELQEIIRACHDAGFRMIEFDRDADELLEYV